MDTTVSIGVIGIMENKMETTKGGSKQCRAFECQRSSPQAHYATMLRSHATPQSWEFSEFTAISDR